MTSGTRRPTTTPAPGDVLCPECGVTVQPDWDWCRACGFDPDHLRDDVPGAPRVLPTAATEPAQTSTRPNDGITAAQLAHLKRPVVAPPMSLPPSRSSGPGAVELPSGVASGPPVVAGPPLALPYRKRGRWWLALAALVVVALVTVGVVVARRGSGGTPIGAKVIGLRDLPSRWAPVPPSSPLATSAESCLVTLTGGDGAASGPPRAAVGFRSASGFPNLVEEIEKYTPARAHDQFSSQLGLVLHGCAPKTSSVARTRRSGAPSTLTLLVRPREGDESASFTIPQRDGTTVTVFLGRSGAYLVTLAVVSRGPVDRQLFDLAVSAAMTKLLD